MDSIVEQKHIGFRWVIAIAKRKQYCKMLGKNHGALIAAIL